MLFAVPLNTLTTPEKRYVNFAYRYGILLSFFFTLIPKLLIRCRVMSHNRNATACCTHNEIANGKEMFSKNTWRVKVLLLKTKIWLTCKIVSLGRDEKYAQWRGKLLNTRCVCGWTWASTCNAMEYYLYRDVLSRDV